VAAACAARGGGEAAWAREAAFTGGVLGSGVDDNFKNYHAWAHRGWALALLAPASAGFHAARSDELAFTQALLAADARNNSAWNHRHRLLTAAAAAPAERAAELVLMRAAVAASPRNESVWAHAAGLLAAWREDAAFPAAVLQLCADEAERTGCPHASALLAEAAQAAGQGERARAVFLGLAAADPIRGHYYALRAAGCGPQTA